METDQVFVSSLSDAELTRRLSDLVGAERENLDALLVHLAEFDSRELAILKFACSSLFNYCTQRLGYSEGATARRIYAARAAKKYPIIRQMLSSRELHLDAVARLGPHLTDANHLELLTKAKGMTRTELKFLVASLDPKRDKADHVRVLQGATGTAEPRAEAGSPPTDAVTSGGNQPPDMFSAPQAAQDDRPSSPGPSPWQRMAERHVIEPLSETRVRIAFTGSQELLDMVDRARDLLKHKYPAGQLEGIFLDALDALLDKKDPDRRLRRLEQTGRRPPDPEDCDPFSRRIPQAVRDAVWRRDGGQCAHVDPDGARCPERGGLEFDHIVPHALGGPSNNPKNIRLLCRGHNRAAAIGIFGEAVTRHWTRPS